MSFALRNFESVKIGVIGYGYWGPNLVRNFAETEDTEVVWCADKRPDRRALVKKRFPTLNTTDNADAIFDDPSVDAVVIATPVTTHFSSRQTRTRKGQACACGKANDPYCG